MLSRIAGSFSMLVITSLALSGSTQNLEAGVAKTFFIASSLVEYLSWLKNALRSSMLRALLKSLVAPFLFIFFKFWISDRFIVGLIVHVAKLMYVNGIFQI